MSARSRASPWFGTLGRRLEEAETEARAEEVRRDGLPGYEGLGEISAIVKGWQERPGFREAFVRVMGVA